MNVRPPDVSFSTAAVDRYLGEVQTLRFRQSRVHRAGPVARSVSKPRVGGSTWTACGVRPHWMLRNSPSRHATAHANSSGHPVIRSFEPGEDWFWDYRKNEYVDGPRLAPPQHHPLDQPVPGPAGRVPANWHLPLGVAMTPPGPMPPGAWDSRTRRTSPGAGYLQLHSRRRGSTPLAALFVTGILISNSSLPSSQDGTAGLEGPHPVANPLGELGTRPGMWASPRGAEVGDPDTHVDLALTRRGDLFHGAAVAEWNLTYSAVNRMNPAITGTHRRAPLRRRGVEGSTVSPGAGDGTVHWGPTMRRCRVVDDATLTFLRSLLASSSPW